ncbi:MAG: hypothetical protein M1482_11740, partial [Chloroflexi bacterium]|nr:hypothetical protein [Chloroflexota bacterium]
QARQLFPGLPLFALVFTLGLAWLWHSRRTAVLSAAYAGLLVLDVLVLAYLGATFAGPATPLANLSRLGGANAPVDFGNEIRVVDYTVQPTHVAAGGTIVVQVQWQAVFDVDQSYWMLLQLADKQGNVANKDAVPAAGRPTTDWWHAGQVFTSHHRFDLPQDLAPGTYVLRLGLHPFDVWEWLPVRGQDMVALGTIQVTPAQ